MTTATGLRVLTWNLHGGVGLDGVRDYSRALDCLMGVEADIIALQEIDGRGWQSTVTPFEDFRQRLGFHGIFATAISAPEGDYGQLLLSRWPLIGCCIHDISMPGCEPRRAIAATVQTGFGGILVIATHLGLRLRERRKQAEILCDLAARSDLPTIMMGDFNDWARFQTTRGRLERIMPAFTRQRTYPSRSPIFALDRIYCRPHRLLGTSRVVKTARIISDHLPLVADVLPQNVHAADGSTGTS
jgi:endonuclease/exonuclease/phosphatase family metal-dependent hydrolase